MGSPRKSSSSVNTTPRSNAHSTQPGKEPQSTFVSSQSIPVKTLNQTSSGHQFSSEGEAENFNQERFKSIRNRAPEKHQNLRQNADLCTFDVSKATENSAIIIQKMWRGYYIRKKNTVAEKIQHKKQQNYMSKLTQDMEETKAALENERKIQQLQMHAINALWKKVSALQQQQQQLTSTTTTPVVQNIFEETLKTTTLSLNFDNQSVNVVQDLTKTCSILITQVSQLQSSLKEMVKCMAQFNVNSCENGQTKYFSSDSHPKGTIETQTEIVAVHTPHIETFPFSNMSHSVSNDTNNIENKTKNNNNKLLRPSSLPISSSTETSPKNFRYNSHQISNISENKKGDLLQTLVVNTSNISFADDSSRTDNEAVSELESEKDKNDVVTEMEKGEDETIADASSITEN